MLQNLAQNLQFVGFDSHGFDFIFLFVLQKNYLYTHLLQMGVSITFALRSNDSKLEHFIGNV